MSDNPNAKTYLPDELINLIETHLNEKFALQARRGRENETAKKGNQIFAQDIGTPIFQYLDTIYWTRIVNYIDSQITPLQSTANQALSVANAALALHRTMAPVSPAIINRDNTG